MATKKDQGASGTAIATAGGVTAGTGLAAGGIPGAKSQGMGVFNENKGKVKRLFRSDQEGRPPAAKAGLGGILGFRTSIHEGGTEYFRGLARQHNEKPVRNPNDAFKRARNAGKIAPEEVVMRNMRAGKKAAGAALVGGTAAAAYGVHRAKGQREKVKKSERHSDKWNAALAGTGGAGLAVSGGGSKILHGQRKKWEARAAQSIDEGGKLVPSTGGRKDPEKTDRQIARQIKRRPGVPFPKTHHPVVSDKDIVTGGHLKDVSNETATKLGHLRGAHAQQSYFGHVYGKTGKMLGKGKVPSAIAATAGAGGLLATRLRDEKVKKRALMSDAELRRRKKLQGTISQTTSTLGLGGLGITGAAALAARKPGVLRAVQKLPKMKKATPESMKNTAINTGIVSGGIGGVGGYNFAAYTNAESRKRKQTVGKSMDIEMGYFGDEGHQLSLPEIEVSIEKAWEPTASNYDSEAGRKKRNKTYESATLVGAGAGGAYTAHHGVKAVKEAKKVKPRQMAPVTPKKVNANDVRMVPHWKSPGHLLHEKAVPISSLKPALKHGGKAAAGAALVGAAAAGHGAMKRKRKSEWKSYSKRDAVSAFGVDHLLVSEEST